MSTSSTTQPPPPPPAPRGFSAMTGYMSAHKIEAGLWLTRLMTVGFTFNYFFPFFPFSADPISTYYKALMANAATSALRLHQRVPSVQLSRQFFAGLLLEDSAHYLIYSLIFIFCAPITAALMPIVLFAILHSASFTLTLLDQIGTSQSWWGARFLISLVELHSRNILRMVAFSEIFLMPLVIVFVFSGRTSIVTPFIYYRFLGLRYSSRRNPYTRAIFHELRLAIEDAASSPRFPQGARVLVHKVIAYISTLAPIQTPQAQN